MLRDVMPCLLRSKVLTVLGFFCLYTTVIVYLSQKAHNQQRIDDAWTFTLPSIATTMHLGDVGSENGQEKLSWSANKFISINLPPPARIAGQRDIGFPRDLVIGVPSVARPTQDRYIHITLRSLLGKLTAQEKNQTRVVLLLANPENETFDEEVIEMLTKKFTDELNVGLLTIVVPPLAYYPNLREAAGADHVITFGDSYSRVRWRMKQNLDYAYLMNYCKDLGKYYLQLEDDVITKHGYVTTMLQHAEKYDWLNTDWLYIEFSKLGMIGKLFKTKDLPALIAYILQFFWLKPVDWLIWDLSHVLCHPSGQLRGPCRTYKESFIIPFKGSLFQHIGEYSSYGGTRNRLRDGMFNAESPFA